MSQVVAGMPSMEAESKRASSTCSDTCSKDRVRHGNGGGFFKITGLATGYTGNQSPPPVRAFFMGVWEHEAPDIQGKSGQAVKGKPILPGRDFQAKMFCGKNILVAAESGGKPRALQTLRAVCEQRVSREAFGVRSLQRRFSSDMP